MRTIRLLLVVLGGAALGYGGWLLRGQLGPALPWLVGGPLLHDALVAPLVAVVGLALRRLVGDPVRRAWLTAGLVVSAILLLVAVPLLWRPAPAPPNPGLQDRDYPLGLAVWLALLWGGISVAAVTARPDAPRAARPDTPRDTRPDAGNGARPDAPDAAPRGARPDAPSAARDDRRDAAHPHTPGR
ncbi:hypothetical protein AB0J86_25050 [Micromonospora sp. NPDC049559]|uniref:hypothetical protein n=1 Tax=Micromonospora sp. NPDC049559 TaxID=3155923 RepID=UPI0034227F82